MRCATGVWMACCLLGGCYLSSSRDGGGDSSTAGQGGGSVSPQPVVACPESESWSLLQPTGCSGGPDPFVREVATCFVCDVPAAQVRVGNAGDAPIATGFDIEVTSSAGEVRSYTIEEALEPGEISAVYELGTRQDVDVRVVPRGVDCDPTNNSARILFDDSGCH